MLFDFAPHHPFFSILSTTLAGRRLASPSSGSSDKCAHFSERVWRQVLEIVVLSGGALAKPWAAPTLRRRWCTPGSRSCRMLATFSGHRATNSSQTLRYCSHYTVKLYANHSVRYTAQRSDGNDDHDGIRKGRGPGGDLGGPRAPELQVHILNARTRGCNLGLDRVDGCVAEGCEIGSA